MNSVQMFRHAVELNSQDEKSASASVDEIIAFLKEPLSKASNHWQGISNPDEMSKLIESCSQWLRNLNSPSQEDHCRTTRFVSMLWSDLFCYRGQYHVRFDDVIQDGKVTVCTGANGVGKSTLLHLILFGIYGQLPGVTMTKRECAEEFKHSANEGERGATVVPGRSMVKLFLQHDREFYCFDRRFERADRSVLTLLKSHPVGESVQSESAGARLQEIIHRLHDPTVWKVQSTKDHQSTITSVFGDLQSTLLKNFSIQDRANTFLSLPDDKKYEAMMQCIGLGPLLKMKERVEKMRKDLQGGAGNTREPAAQRIKRISDEYNRDCSKAEETRKNIQDGEAIVSRLNTKETDLKRQLESIGQIRQKTERYKTLEDVLRTQQTLNGTETKVPCLQDAVDGLLRHPHLVALLRTYPRIAEAFRPISEMSTSKDGETISQKTLNDTLRCLEEVSAELSKEKAVIDSTVTPADMESLVRHYLICTGSRALLHSLSDSVDGPRTGLRALLPEVRSSLSSLMGKGNGDTYGLGVTALQKVQVVLNRESINVESTSTSEPRVVKRRSKGDGSTRASKRRRCDDAQKTKSETGRLRTMVDQLLIQLNEGIAHGDSFLIEDPSSKIDPLRYLRVEIDSCRLETMRSKIQNLVLLLDIIKSRLNHHRLASEVVACRKHATETISRIRPEVEQRSSGGKISSNSDGDQVQVDSPDSEASIPWSWVKIKAEIDREEAGIVSLIRQTVTDREASIREQKDQNLLLVTINQRIALYMSEITREKAMARRSESIEGWLGRWPMVMRTLEKIVTETFQARTNKILSVVPGHAGVRVILKRDSLTVSRKPKLMIRSQTDDHSVQLMSGFERFASSLALRIALSSLSINNSSACRQFFIDEGFGSMDEDHRQSLPLVFRSLRKLDIGLFVISHQESVQKIADRLLYIRKESSGPCSVSFSMRSNDDKV